MTLEKLPQQDSGDLPVHPVVTVGCHMAGTA